MTYIYDDLRDTTFTDKGQKRLIETRDKVLKLLDKSGAVRMGEILPTGDSWEGLATIDRLVELGDIREIQQMGHVAGQHRIFVKS